MAKNARPPQKTILFLGATGGSAFSALRRSLLAGHNCVALCRTPSKLTNKLPVELRAAPNLRIEQGSADDVDRLVTCLPADLVFSAIGSYPKLSKLGGIEDPTLCRRGMAALAEALERVGGGPTRVVAMSTTGLSRLGRDVPLLMAPLYHVALRAPHEDKRAMESVLMGCAAADWTVVRASALTSGPEAGAEVRVGVEDSAAGKVESRAVGYTISREDVGRWIFENLVQETDRRWVSKTATITY